MPRDAVRCSQHQGSDRDVNAPVLQLPPGAESSCPGFVAAAHDLFIAISTATGVVWLAVYTGTAADRGRRLAPG